MRISKLSGRLAALTLACAALFSGAAQADALADIKKAGVIKIAVPQDFPPFGSVGRDLKPQGYDIDMANLKLGIFSKAVKPETPLREGDRVEIYRPLLADPKAVRRQRAEAGKAMKKGG